MYKKFFGFQDMPFSQTAYNGPDFVFTSQSYTMVLPTLVSSLDRNVALTLVLGENGVGKTVFINYVYDFLQQDSCVMLINAGLESAQGFFQQVLTSFEQKADNPDAHEILMRLGFLNTGLNEQDSLATILIIDDADSMDLDALKAIELLLGLNAENNQVLQLILVGQPKLKNILNLPVLHGLMQNTAAHCLLEALSLEETQDYINHKIHLAGGQNRKLFTEQACSVIYEYSKGLPAIINWVCDKALLRSNELQKHEICSELIAEVIREQSGVPEKRTPWLFLTIFSLVVIGIVLALLFLPKKFISPSKDPQIELSSKLEKIPARNQSSVQIPDLVKTHQQEDNPKEQIKKKVFIEENQQNKILKEAIFETQFSIAELQFANLQITAPEKDNAYETYLEILKVAPDNKRAKEGIQSIVRYYFDQAKKRYIKGRLEKSLLSASKGLKVSPNNKDLIKLKMKITVELKQAERQNTINALFKQAKRQTDALQLIRPVNDNAYKTYQDIAAFDKNNRQARQGILKIFSQLKAAVQKSLDRERYTEAFEITKKITQLSSSKRLSDPFHKEAVFTASEIRNIVDKQLIKLLILAEEQLIMRKFTLPFGDNAFESYNNALQLDHSSKGANKGLDKLKKRYRELVATAISEGNNDLAIETVNEGLKAFPDDRELQSLRSESILQNEMAIKKAKDYVDEKNSEEKDQELKNFGTF